MGKDRGIGQERSMRVGERAHLKSCCDAGGNDVHMGGLRRKWNQVRKEDEGEE